MIIAIDPDCDRSGVAIYHSIDNPIELQSMSFPQLLQFILDNKQCLDAIYIETGWLNKSNWHLGKDLSAKVCAQIGNRTGRNHETGRKLIEMLDYYGVSYHGIMPLSKKDRKRYGCAGDKITHVELIAIMQISKKRSNQDERDAALLLYDCMQKYKQASNE